MNIVSWQQRRLRGKLHLPFFTTETKPTIAESLDTIKSRPICGRHLRNRRERHEQTMDGLEFADSVEEFTWQLMSGKACRHCAVKADLLVRTITIREEESEE